MPFPRFSRTHGGVDPSSTMGDLADLASEVKDLTSGLPAGEDDLVELLEPTGPAAQTGETDLVAPDISGALGEEAELDSRWDIPVRRHDVTAVLVCHDGARWLPAVLTSLARLDPQPQRLIAVDVGSTDATPRLLSQAASAGVIDAIIATDAHSGVGDSVRRALDHLPTSQDDGLGWVWILHDDAAPSVGALGEMLTTSDANPDAAVLGPKIRGWHDRRLLLERGVSIARSGNRVTGLDKREYDQGQYDSNRDVLAVSTAGMLARRDVWEELGGLDPHLPMFRDDIDFGWRARLAGHRVILVGDAVLYHREAAAHARRSITAGLPEGRSEHHVDRIDRAAALHLLLAHASRATLLFVAIRLLVGSVVRSLGLLLGKSPERAGDELAAVADVLRGLPAVMASRRLVHQAGHQPNSVANNEVRQFLAPRGAQARSAWHGLVDLVWTGGEGAESGRSALETGPSEDDGWAQVRTPSRIRRLLTRPGVLLTLGLIATTLVAVRGLLGDGSLAGGALLPAPLGAGDLIATYTSGWHEVATGSPADTPVWLLLLTIPTAFLRGQVPLAVDLLVLGAVPLAGASAYAALRGLGTSTWVRVWAALTYALLPAVTIGVAGGRLGTCVVSALLPWVARSFARLLGAGRTPTWRRAWGTALVLAAAAAFAPAVWVVAAFVALGSMVMLPGATRRLQVLAAVLAPLLLLGPWTLRLIESPGLLLLEPGMTGPVDRNLDGVDLLLLHPGGPGATPLWVTAGLLVGAVAVLLRRTLWRAILPAWIVAVLAWSFGLVQLAARVSVDGVPDPVRPWPGVATLIAGAALIVAISVGTVGLRARVAGLSFSWRQPITALVVASCVLAPVASTAVWLTGVDGPLHREDPSVVPAFVSADMLGKDRPRVLVLSPRRDRVAYELLSNPVTSLGDRDVAPATAAGLDRAVSDLVAGRVANEVEVLSAWAVRYVLLRDNPEGTVARVLDGEPGLRRVAGESGATLWRVSVPTARVQVVPGRTTSAPPVAVKGRMTTALPVAQGNDRQAIAVDGAKVPAALLPGTLVVAESADSGWVLRSGTLASPADSLTLSETSGVVAPGRMSAAVPIGVVTVSLSYEDQRRSRALWLQLLVVFVVVVLALPSARKEQDDDESDEADQWAVATDDTRAAPQVVGA